MMVCVGNQWYWKRNHASHVMPSPVNALLVATAYRANEFTLNTPFSDMVNTPVFTAAMARGYDGEEMRIRKPNAGRNK